MAKHGIQERDLLCSIHWWCLVFVVDGMRIWGCSAEHAPNALLTVLLFAGEHGQLECFDLRAPRSVGCLDAVAEAGAAGEALTALRFDDRGAGTDSRVCCARGTTTTSTRPRLSQPNPRPEQVSTWQLAPAMAWWRSLTFARLALGWSKTICTPRPSSTSSSMPMHWHAQQSGGSYPPTSTLCG